MVQRPKMTRGQRALVVIVVVGVAIIASIGFVGSYTAVQHLAEREGFGWFSYALPAGVDAGIIVFLAVDLLLTWLRIPLPLLRYLAWMLTVATIVFNAASAWPRPLATGMHATVPVLFIAAIEAARHAVGRITAIDADQYMEGTRIGRWVLAPIATFRLWRRRQLWELRSYQEAVELERRRLVYRARLKAAYGRDWRRQAPVDQLLVLKLANLGEPLPAFHLDVTSLDRVTSPTPMPAVGPAVESTPALAAAALLPGPRQDASLVPGGEPAPATPKPEEAGVAHTLDHPAELQQSDDPGTRGPRAAANLSPTPSAGSAVDRYYQGFCAYHKQHGAFPDGEQLGKWLWEESGIKGRGGEALTAGHLRRYLPSFRDRWQGEEQPAPSDGNADHDVAGAQLVP